MIDRPAVALAALLLAGCPSADPEPPGPPAEDLPPPDLSAVDLDAAIIDAVDLLTRATMRPVWDGHLAALAGVGASCPTLWTGTPSGVGDGEPGDDGAGWQDDCTVGAYAYDGSLGWSAQADPESAVIGRRNLAAIATVQQGGSPLFALRGEAADSLRLDEDGARWTYSSTFAGDVSGSAVLDPDLPALPGGWRGANDITWVGGTRWSLEISANLAFIEQRIQDTFDAVDVEAFVPGPGSDEGGCDNEPHGRVSLRIPPGTWVDVQFWVAPAEGEDPEQIVTNACDGCGTVSVRRVGLGEACPDSAPMWTAERLPSAELLDFVLPTRELTSEAR